VSFGAAISTGSLVRCDLLGGPVNPDVARVGEPVRRAMGARAPFIHDLLIHLERVGFDGAPRFFGVDDVGREIISFLPGAPIPGTEILTDRETQSAATWQTHSLRGGPGCPLSRLQPVWAGQLVGHFQGKRSPQSRVAPK